MANIKFSQESFEPIVNKIGALTKVQRYLIYFGSIIAIIGLFVWFSWLPKHEKIEALETEEK